MTEQPTKIGKYQIKRVLGKGAMGVVYEAFDPDIERRVAIKTLHPHLISDNDGDEFLTRFKREAQAAARCMHPNIVMVMEYGTDNDTPFIAMEYVEGTALNDLIRSEHSFSLKQIFNIISQMLKALSTAHGQGIVHRDIKPANVMVLKNGAVKLADFGIARIENSGDLTQVGALMGTPRFMAPEQTFGLPVNHRADLFSAAMIFYELLGKLPNNLPLAVSNLPKIDGLSPNNRINYQQTIPAALVNVVLKGLSPKAEERFQDAKEFALAIKQVIPELKAGKNLNEGSSKLEAEQAIPNSSPEELKAMESLLASYIGPMAKKLITHKIRLHPDNIDALAQNLSEKIPNHNEREQFLKRWDNRGLELGSGLNSIASNPSLSNTLNNADSTHLSQASQTLLTKSIDEDTLIKLRDDYASYVGPMAARLIKRQADNVISLSELVHGLAADIPNTKERDKFIAHWSN